MRLQTWPGMQRLWLGGSGSWLHLRLALRALRSRQSVLKTEWRQDGRTVVGVAALLHFHFREEHGGSGCGHRNAATFSATDTVKDVELVAGGDDARESGERSAN